MYDTITQILQHHIGLMPDSIGTRTLERAIAQCMVEQELRDPQDYVQQLQSPEILQNLVEAVIVPETWFMRDRAPFEFLKAEVRQRTILSETRPLRLLSLPCSTGEEPYSIAISLLEAGLKPAEFQVEGIDISHRSLRRAQSARYGDYSFRNQTPEIRDRYFDHDGIGYQLQRRVCDQVSFRQGNSLETDWIPPLRSYQVIFCRNLLIYLDEASRHRVFANLAAALAPDGILFLGSTESTQPVPAPLQPIRHQGTLLYIKQSTKTQQFHKQSNPALQSRSTGGKPSPDRPLGRPGDRSGDRPTLGTTTPAVPPPIVPPSSDRAKAIATSSYAPPTPLTPLAPPAPPRPITSMSTVTPLTDDALSPELTGLRQLADAGMIDEAIESCEYYLRGHSSDANGHLLLGELYQAQQLNSRAEQCYRRATYLDPDHRQALIHLALLKEQQGDRHGANLFWRRVDRIKPPPS